MKTAFAIPLAKKRTDFSIRGIFTADGPKEVGDEYRRRFGGPPFPIERDAPSKPRWFCEEPNCTRWSDGDGSHNGGTCSGYCLCF